MSMFVEMKVLVAYPLVSEVLDGWNVISLPDLNGAEEKLRSSLESLRPSVLIVGNNAVGEETLEVWRRVMGEESRLTLIRRGSSLSRIDLVKAKVWNIEVFNTLSVNARFVADYMIEHLHLSPLGVVASPSSSPSIVGIIGSGAIGSRIGSRLNSLGYEVHVYSPSLLTVDPHLLEGTRRRKGLGSERIRIASTAEEAIERATHVLLAIDAERVVDPEEKLSVRFVQSIIRGARLVSVSEFRVFADGALDLLVHRVREKHFTARLDSHRFDLLTINNPPLDLQLVSEAMKGKGCGEAMDQAVLILLSNIALQQTFQTSTIIPSWKSLHPKEISQQSHHHSPSTKLNFSERQTSSLWSSFCNRLSPSTSQKARMNHH